MSSLLTLIAVRFVFGLGEGIESGAHFKALGDRYGSHERFAATGLFHTALAWVPRCRADRFAGLVVMGAVGHGVFYRQRALPNGIGDALAGVGRFAADEAQTAATSLAALSFAAFFLYGGFSLFWAVVLDAVPGHTRGAICGFVNLG